MLSTHNKVLLVGLFFPQKHAQALEQHQSAAGSMGVTLGRLQYPRDVCASDPLIATARFPEPTTPTLTLSSKEAVPLDSSPYSCFRNIATEEFDAE